MKVISLLQPWASLVVIGAKKIETRSWVTKHRGPLLIHASAKPMTKEYVKMLENWTVNFGVPCFQEETYPYGAIIGVVNLNWIVESKYCTLGNQFEDKDKIFKVTEEELAFGDYSPGRYGWLLSDPVQFAQPIPAKGKLGLWDFDMPDHFHIPTKYGGHGTFPQPPTKEVLDAVNAMVEIAYKNLKK